MISVYKLDGNWDCDADIFQKKKEAAYFISCM